MTPSRRAFLHLAAAGAAITANATAAFAQDYPARPARIVSGFPPGGVWHHARLIGQRLSEHLGQLPGLALADAAMTRRISELGDTPLSLSTTDFAKLVDDETAKWRRVILAAHIRAE